MDPIKQLPPSLDGSRVESGPVQFGEDWPGVFIRGDSSAMYAAYLEEIGVEILDRSPVAASVLRNLIDLLRSCDLTRR